MDRGRRVLRVAAAAALVLVAVAAAPGCGDRPAVAQSSGSVVEDPPTPRPPGPYVVDGAPLPGPCAALTAGTALKLAPVVAGLHRPVYVTAPKGDPRLFILEQDGFVRVLKDGAVAETPFLDVSREIRTRNPEQGLLGMAFHPRYPADPRVFVHFTQRAGGTAIVEYRVDPKAPDVVDAASANVLLEVEQPYGNHNGGHLEFSPADGYLYIGLGDGGAANDPHEHGQNKGTLLGTMLRIDVDTPPPQGAAYAIPPSNPFVDEPGVRPEIWAWGLRNPWRYHFDPVTHELVIGDVGQNAVEELDYHAPGMKAGTNYGWDVHEGTHCFGGHDGCGEDGLAMPLIEFEAYAPCNSITGGPVYRGTCLPELAGTWFWSDYCHDFIATFRIQGGVAVDRQDLTKSLDPDHRKLIGVSSFGVDGFGEVYVLSHRSGVVYRFVGG